MHGKHMPQVIEHTVRTYGNFDFSVQCPFSFHLSQNFAVLLLSLQSVIKIKLTIASHLIIKRLRYYEDALLTNSKI